MAFFLSDDLTQQDKIDELEKIRLLLKQYGSDAAEVSSDAKLADEVTRIIGHFSAGWVSFFFNFYQNPFLSHLTNFYPEYCKR